MIRDLLQQGHLSNRNRLFPETFSGALFPAFYLVCLAGGGGRPQGFELSLSRTLRLSTTKQDIEAVEIERLVYRTYCSLALEYTPKNLKSEVVAHSCSL